MMYKNNDMISPGQFAHILILTVVGTGILTLPRELADGVGPDGIFVLLLSALFTLVAANIIGYIIKRFPGKGYFEILTICFTKPIAYIITLLFVVYALLINAFIIRVFGEVIKMFLLIKTPIELIIFSILIITAFLARGGIEPLGRMAELLFPMIVIPALLLFLLAAADVNLTNLLPVFQASPLEIIRAVPAGFLSFAGFEFVLIFGKYLNKPEKATKAMSIGIGVVSLIYLIIYIVTLGVFGRYQMNHLIWPTLTVFKVISFPGLFIDNIESLVMVIWIFIVFMSIAPMHLSKTILLGDLLKLRERDFLALPIVPILYLIALIPDSLAETYEYMGPFSNYAITFFSIVIPVIILILSVFRKNKGRESGSNA